MMKIKRNSLHKLGYLEAVILLKNVFVIKNVYKNEKLLLLLAKKNTHIISVKGVNNVLMNKLENHFSFVIHISCLNIT